MKNRYCVYMLWMLFLSISSSAALSQEDTNKVVPPPPPPPESWEELSTDEKEMFISLKSSIPLNNINSDSCLNVLINYLCSHAKLNYYRVSEAIKLISHIPRDRSILFFLSNVDYYMPSPKSFRRMDWKNYPFFYILISDEFSHRKLEIVQALLESKILEDCEIKEAKLSFWARIFIEKFASNEFALSLLDYYLSNEKNSCKISNLKVIQKLISTPDSPFIYPPAKKIVPK